ncbi:MAG: hypothetical protein HQ559_12875 [Lentisphaerae bacterium]|nr:hypothetical protein [Lentisphaerota bacterium]
MKTTPLCKTLVLAVMLLLGVSAVRFWNRAARVQSDIGRWSKELPVDMQLDLSQPGVYRTTGVFSCPAACGHGMHLYLLVSGGDEAAVSPQAVARELILNCSIKDKNGATISSFTVSDDGTLAPYQGQILLGSTPYVGPKINILEIVVARGASVLEGRSQRIIGMYDVCEVEHLTVKVARGLSIACAVLALALAAALLIDAVR